MLSGHKYFVAIHQVMYDVYIKILLLKEDLVLEKPLNSLF